MKLFLISIFLWPFAAFSQLKVAKIFSNNMVLQRDQPVHFWGKGLPGEKVLISFSGDQNEVVVKSDSSWNIYFKKQKVNAIPQSVQIKSGYEEVELKNILIGDVWICSGQSNMEWPMNGEMFFEEELKVADNAELRFYNPVFVGKNIYGQAYTPQQREKLEQGAFYKGSWEVSDTASFRRMSAVGYYFGKEINQKAGVPLP